jgi:hypothetical protein
MANKIEENKAERFRQSIKTDFAKLVNGDVNVEEAIERIANERGVDTSYVEVLLGIDLLKAKSVASIVEDIEIGVDGIVGGDEQLFPSITIECEWSMQATDLAKELDINIGDLDSAHDLLDLVEESDEVKESIFRLIYKDIKEYHQITDGIKIEKGFTYVDVDSGNFGHAVMYFGVRATGTKEILEVVANTNGGILIYEWEETLDENTTASIAVATPPIGTKRKVNEAYIKPNGELEDMSWTIDEEDVIEELGEILGFLEHQFGDRVNGYVNKEGVKLEFSVDQTPITVVRNAVESFMKEEGYSFTVKIKNTTHYNTTYIIE